MELADTRDLESRTFELRPKGERMEVGASGYVGRGGKRRVGEPGLATTYGRAWLVLRCAATAPRDPELCELRGDHLALRRRTHLFVDMQDPAVDADVEGPP
jgi:hypothetical protein